MVVHQTLAPLTTIMGLVFFRKRDLFCLKEKIKHIRSIIPYGFYWHIGYGILQFFLAPMEAELPYLSNFGNAEGE